LDAAAAEILSLLHQFFRGISPKIGISIYCSLCVAIAQNRCFLATAPVRDREEKQPIPLLGDRTETSQNPSISSLRRKSCSRRKTI